MRALAAFAALSGLMPITAQASSFVTPAAPKKPSSFIALGAPAPAAVAERVEPAPVEPAPITLAPASKVALVTGFEPKLDRFQPPAADEIAAPAPRIVSASIIALGTPAPAVTMEKVASTTPAKTTAKAARARAFDPAPLVIRGGLTDIAAGAGAPVAEEPSKTAAAERHQRHEPGPVGREEPQPEPPPPPNTTEPR